MTSFQARPKPHTSGVNQTLGRPPYHGPRPCSPPRHRPLSRPPDNAKWPVHQPNRHPPAQQSQLTQSARPNHLRTASRTAETQNRAKPKRSTPPPTRPPDRPNQTNRTQCAASFHDLPKPTDTSSGTSSL